MKGKNKICGIYEIKNVLNNHRYIGSSVSIMKRWYEHKRTLNKESHHSIYLQRAWNKYGKKQFEFKILEECKPIKETLELIEQKYIDDLNPEYNMTQEVKRPNGIIRTPEQNKAFGLKYRGENHHAYGKSRSQEVCDKISKANIGKVPSEKTREIWSKQRIGRKHSEETKKKISKGNLGKKNTEEAKKRMSYIQRSRYRKTAKKVLMLDIDTEEEINEFKSIRAAARYLGKVELYRVGISACANNKIAYSSGYKWKFKEVEHASI